MAKVQGLDMKQMDSQMMKAMRIPNKDAAFLKGMIAHHEGAIQMAEDEIRNGQNPAAKRIAQKILVEQKVQVQKMQRILKSL